MGATTLTGRARISKIKKHIEMKIYHGLFSECGPREINEDYICHKYLTEQNRAVFVLCDGMGGHNCGEVASRFVAEHICGYWEKNPKQTDSEKKLMEACQETKMAYDSKSPVEMGTTMAMAAIEGNKAMLAHCGDSRIYVVRDNEIIYQSVDHVALTPEGWPLITRVFFTGRNNYCPDITEIELEVGDIILICSDGVYGNGKWRKVNEALKGEMLGAYILSNIFSVAKENAHDNYSAILIRICDDEPEDTSDPHLFKISRQVKDENGWHKSPQKSVEYFRTRREAHTRLTELNCFNQCPDNVRYSCCRCADGLELTWK